MEWDYDVVVVGGGPSGLQFAREVTSRSDHSVAVLERNEDLRDNDKSTGGTFPEVVEGYDVPDEAVMAEASGVAFEGPTNRSRHAMTSYVLDFPEFLAFLGEEASSGGAEIRTGTHVTGPIVEDGTVRGVRFRDVDGRGGGSGGGGGDGDDGGGGSGGGGVDGDSGDGGDSGGGGGGGGDGERELRARITVDASGPSAALTSELGLFDTATAQRGVGLEFEIQGEYDTDDALLFRFDHDDAPGGYAWTFPAGKNVFKAGVCWMDEFHEVRAGGGSVRGRADGDSGSGRPDGDSVHARVERWVEADSRWTAEEVRAKHAGVGVWNDSMNHRAADGLLAVGDAISSINPLFGEGIRPGMESATMAADTALSALDAGDTSESRLREYERRWNETHGRSWKLQRIVGELLYDFDADQQDEFVERVKRLSPRQAEQLRRYDLDALSLARLYPFRLKDLSKLPRIVSYL